MKKNQILAALTVLSGFALLSACGTTSGGASATVPEKTYNCSGASSNKLISAIDVTNAQAKFCSEENGAAYQADACTQFKIQPPQCSLANQSSGSVTATPLPATPVKHDYVCTGWWGTGTYYNVYKEQAETTYCNHVSSYRTVSSDADRENCLATKRPTCTPTN